MASRIQENLPKENVSLVHRNKLSYTKEKNHCSEADSSEPRLTLEGSRGSSREDSRESPRGSGFWPLFALVQEWRPQTNGEPQTTDPLMSATESQATRADQP